MIEIDIYNDYKLREFKALFNFIETFKPQKLLNTLDKIKFSKYFFKKNTLVFRKSLIFIL